MTTAREIQVVYRSIDGVRIARKFKTIEGAQRFAAKYVGRYPELGVGYAVSGDGVGKVEVWGAPLADLFPSEQAKPTESVYYLSNEGHVIGAGLPTQEQANAAAWDLVEQGYAIRIEHWAGEEFVRYLGVTQPALFGPALPDGTWAVIETRAVHCPIRDGIIGEDRRPVLIVADQAAAIEGVRRFYDAHDEDDEIGFHAARLVAGRWERGAARLGPVAAPADDWDVPF